MTGAEYLTAAGLESLWDEMAAAFRDERERSGLGTQELLQRWSAAWNLVGRVLPQVNPAEVDDDSKTQGKTPYPKPSQAPWAEQRDVAPPVCMTAGGGRFRGRSPIRNRSGFSSLDQGVGSSHAFGPSRCR